MALFGGPQPAASDKTLGLSEGGTRPSSNRAKVLRSNGLECASHYLESEKARWGFRMAVCGGGDGFLGRFDGCRRKVAMRRVRAECVIACEKRALMGISGKPWCRLF